MPKCEVYLTGEAYEVWQKMPNRSRSPLIAKFLIETDIKSKNPTPKQHPKAIIEVINK